MKNEKTANPHKVRTPYNSQPSRGQIFTQESKTIPDLSLSLRVLIERHSRGMPVSAAMFTPVYDNEGEAEKKLGGVNIQTLDLVERQELKEQVDLEIKKATDHQKFIKNETEKKKRASELEKAAEELLVRRSKDSKTDSE